MIIAGPNLTIDRTLTIDTLRPGEVLRFSSAEITPGGKGVNVARVAKVLGAQALLVGFIPGATGRAVGELLDEEGLTLVRVPVTGEVRSAAVILESSGRVTVLNEPGPQISSQDWEKYERTVAQRMAGHGVLVCSGSVPPGSPPDAYARLARHARSQGLRSLIDATGEQLQSALEADVDFVVPNVGEAEGLLHGAASEDVDVPAAEAQERATAAARALATRAVRIAIVTAGAAGAAVARGGRCWWVPAPRVDVRNPIGAGDSFAAGLAIALERGADVLDAITSGVGTAAASVENLLAGRVDPGRVRELTAATGATAVSAGGGDRGGA